MGFAGSTDFMLRVQDLVDLEGMLPGSGAGPQHCNSRSSFRVQFLPRVKNSEGDQRWRMHKMDSGNMAESRSGKAFLPSLQDYLADLRASQLRISPFTAMSGSDVDDDEGFSSSIASAQKRLHFDNYNLSLDHEDSVEDASSSTYCPVFLSGGSLIGYDHRSRSWCRIFSHQCLQPDGDFISPRMTFEGPMMLLVWKSMSSEGLLTSDGLVMHVTTGENQSIECLPRSVLLEESMSEDPAVDPYAIRLIRNCMYRIVMLFVTFFETWTRIQIQGARFTGTTDGIVPCWESRVWVLRADTYETQSSFLARCSAYVRGNLLCLWRASETFEAGQYHLWKLDVEVGVFDVLFIEVPHTWTCSDEADDALIWSPCVNSDDQVEVEALECSVLFCASRLFLVFLFRVGPPPDLDDERRSYFATVRVHEVVHFNPPETNYPPFVSMSPVMCLRTNGDYEYMSTTFVCDQEFLYICPNYNSEVRDRVLAYAVTSREWSLLPPPNPLDLDDWECWGETPLSFNPSLLS